MESDEVAYSLVIPEQVQNKLLAIKDYIERTYLSDEAGIKKITNILVGLEQLEVFPEAGFDADERIGFRVYPPYKTRCIVIGDYLAFYHILEDRKSIFVSDIIHCKEDYMRLLKRGCLK